jgi:hypothetical protein
MACKLVSDLNGRTHVEGIGEKVLERLRRKRQNTEKLIRMYTVSSIIRLSA